MPGKTHSHSDTVLNLMRGQNASAFTPWVGLFTTAPANDGASGTEVSGNGYARQSVTLSAPATGTGNARRCTNSNQITFGPATGTWGTIVAFGIWDASTGGTLRYWDNLPSEHQKSYVANDSMVIAAGELSVSED